jgi:hypothetical protein
MDSNFRFRMPRKGDLGDNRRLRLRAASLDYLWLPSVDISEGGPKRNLEALSERNRKFESRPLQR